MADVIELEEIITEALQQRRGLIHARLKVTELVDPSVCIYHAAPSSRGWICPEGTRSSLLTRTEAWHGHHLDPVASAVRRLAREGRVAVPAGWTRVIPAAAPWSRV